MMEGEVYTMEEVLGDALVDEINTMLQRLQLFLQRQECRPETVFLRRRPRLPVFPSIRRNEDGR